MKDLLEAAARIVLEADDVTYQLLMEIGADDDAYAHAGEMTLQQVAIAALTGSPADRTLSAIGGAILGDPAERPECPRIDALGAYFLLEADEAARCWSLDRAV